MLSIDTVNCAGCKLCEKVCPTGAIKVTAGKAKIDNSICNGCYKCVYVCPNNAIKKKIKFREKVGVSNKEELKELSEMLDDLKNKLVKIEENLNRIESKRR